MRAKSVLILSCILLCISTALLADDVSIETAVKDIIGKMPAENTAVENELSAELIGLGSEPIKVLCQMLGEGGAGTEDDAKAKFALNGLSRYVGRSGAEQERTMYAGLLIECLQEASDKEIKAFFIRQLQWVGKEESVGPLSEYLSDERLCGPATRALVTVNTKALQLNC